MFRMIFFGLLGGGGRGGEEVCRRVKKKSEGRLEVFFYPSHSNALIKDDKYAIVGGFNWLSDNGTSEIGERSWIVSSRDFVIRERDKIVMGR